MIGESVETMGAQKRQKCGQRCCIAATRGLTRMCEVNMIHLRGLGMAHEFREAKVQVKQEINGKSVGSDKFGSDRLEVRIVHPTVSLFHLEHHMIYILIQFDSIQFIFLILIRKLISTYQ